MDSTVGTIGVLRTGRAGPSDRLQASRRDERAHAIDRIGTFAQCVLPGLLIVYFAFNAGGFYPGPPAFAAVILALALATYTAVGRRPFAGFSRTATIAAVALALFTGWTVLSGNWSHAPGRAIVAADRALFYLLVVVVMAAAPRSTTRLRWMVVGVVAASAIVCAVGLATWLFPNHFPTPPSIGTNRLGYPVTYWNALGLVAGFGILLGFNLASSATQPAAARVLGAAAIPLLATTLYFTFSRGAIGITLIGLLAYAALARKWTIVSGLLATLPPTAAVLLVAYGEGKLASTARTTPAGIAQGHHVAVAVVIAAAAAGALRALLVAFDRPLARYRLPRQGRAVLRTMLSVGVAVAFAGAFAAGAGHVLSHEWHRFVNGASAGTSSADARQRLLDPNNDGRIPGWKVALRGFRAHPLDGQGAGTFQLYWERHRPNSFSIRNAHSLYLETLYELGGVGLALLAIGLLALLFGLARQLRRLPHSVYVAIAVVLGAWVVRAGIDWDWQMPVVTAPALALAAAAVARGRQRRVDDSQAGPQKPRRRLLAPLPNPVRLVLGAAFLAIAVIPALVAISDGHLASSVNALDQGDWATARSQAHASLAALGTRAQPYEVIGYADLELGRQTAAMTAMHQAISHDPNNWQYYDDLAVARAAAGLDPRRAAREALVLNPHEPLAGAVAFSFLNGRPSAWRTRSQLVVEYMLNSGVIGAR